MQERSPGKDSVTGHWELMGLVLERAFPTYPLGFPRELIQQFEVRIGRPSLGNVVLAGTTVLERFGARHVETGAPIVYTSADSVFQIAAHEEVVELQTLYRWCEIAYDLAVQRLGMGRVIARPFVGLPGAFTRTTNRHDYAAPPPASTLLDRLTDAGVPVTSIGKIHDLFAGRGTQRSLPTTSDADGMSRIDHAMTEQPDGLIFTNLVECDSLYGHRNDAEGYARNLETFDGWLAGLRAKLLPGDLLAITGDHGNDPTTASTDHSREYVPLLVSASRLSSPIDLGTRLTFADLGQTLADLFHVEPVPHGTSFLDQLVLA
jgi:phosphopentomutase